MYHESPWQMTYWLNCSKTILHPNLHPIWHQACPWNMPKILELFSVVLPYSNENSQFSTCHEQKNNYPPTCFFHVNAILLLGKTIQKWNHLLQVSNFTLIAHANVHNIWVLGEKCNVMFFDKSLYKIPLHYITFMMFMNTHAIFTWFCLKVINHLHLSILGPPSHNSIRFSIRGEFFVVILYFWKCVPIRP
jgi:hypothetical protein